MFRASRWTQLHRGDAATQRIQFKEILSVMVLLHRRDATTQRIRFQERDSHGIAIAAVQTRIHFRENSQRHSVVAVRHAMPLLRARHLRVIKVAVVVRSHPDNGEKRRLRIRAVRRPCGLLGLSHRRGRLTRDRDLSASSRGRPCIEEGIASPSMRRNVGAKSTFPLGMLTVASCRMSGPAAINVL